MTERDDVPQFGRLQARPAPRTPVEHANDMALEYAILTARIVTVLGAFVGLAALLGWVWTGDERWLITSIVLSAIGCGTGWWGWWIKGNAEWRHG